MEYSHQRHVKEADALEKATSGGYNFFISSENAPAHGISTLQEHPQSSGLSVDIGQDLQIVDYLNNSQGDCAIVDLVD
jgi:hypothetical protein